MDIADLLTLQGGEAEAVGAAASGGELRFARPTVVRAEFLRRLMVGLPLDSAKPRPLSPLGLRIRGARIRGRLNLDNVTLPGGGPLPALEFSECDFQGGFSGARSHFTRLAFDECTFHGAPADRTGRPRPSIDLSDSIIDSSLSMIHSRPRSARDCFWIRATGARIAGSLDLSSAHLREPRRISKRLISEAPVEALNLSLAEIKGDLTFLGGARSEGGIGARRAVIRGDVWMSGAHIEVLEGSAGVERGALFLQSAEIGGLLMLDGRPDDAASKGELRPFCAFGMLNLSDLQLGGSLILSDAFLSPPKPRPCKGTGKVAGAAAGGVASTKAVEPDEADVRPRQVEADDYCALRLDQARIGDSVMIRISGGQRSRIAGALCLNQAEIKNRLLISDAFIGVPTLSPAEPAIQAAMLTAGHCVIVNVEPLLWTRPPPGAESDMMPLGLNFLAARLETLIIADSWFNESVSASWLKCAMHVQIDARIGGGLYLEGADIGGSLELSTLRLDPGSPGMTLKEAKVAQALRLASGGTLDEAAMHLVAARRAPLRSLPALELIESLWRYGDDTEASRYYQALFVAAGKSLFLLDGRQESFESLVGRFGYRIDEARQVEEFLRLYLAAVREGSDVRRLIARPEDVPAWLSPSAPIGSRAGAEEALAKEALPPLKVVRRAGGEFQVRARCLDGPTLVDARIRLKPGRELVFVKTLTSVVRSTLAETPRAERRLIAWPEGNGHAGGWIMPPLLEGMAEVPASELPALAAASVRYLASSCAIHGDVELTGLVCGLLDDNCGRAWGVDVRMSINHFVYSRTIWRGLDARDPPRGRRRLRQALTRTAARYMPKWLLRLVRWQPSEASLDSCAGWLARLNWIYRQFAVADLPMPSRYRITQADYSPQPFEQTIDVCRAEGREDYALYFEIEKQKIEWRLFNQRSRAWLLAVGLSAGTLWLALTRYPWPERIAEAALLAVAIATISDAASVSMRVMFGYLRRPVRAVATLVGALLIGWEGVHVANERGFMIIDVAPVASVAETGKAQARLGIQSGHGPLERNVACADAISEPLYALDVLIPLIDLRQESRCDIGLAAHHPRPAGARRWFIDDEGFWTLMKALYAIAGWFIVSLSILTFAQTNRTRGVEEA